MLIKKFKTLNKHVESELSKEKWNGKRSKLDYLKVAADFSTSLKKYNLTPEEYLLLNFYDLDKERRKKIISRNERDEIVECFNSDADMEKLEDKMQFLNNFSDYVNRDFLLLKDATLEDFERFVSKHKEFVAKKSDSGQGRGVELINEISDPKAAFDRLLTDSFDLVEEKIETHPDLKPLSPNGTPPIRVFTFVDKNKQPHIIFSAINLSTDNPVVNFGSGALKAMIDPETGEIITHGLNKQNKTFQKHPVTERPIKGFQIPEWDTLRHMMLEAALLFPSVRYVGWDCTVTDKGPSIIEANAKRPGINGQQMEGFKKADEEYAHFDIVREEFNALKNK